MSFFSIKHHGAVNGVTGSCHELRLNNGPGILIDCGMFQGAEKSSKGANKNQLAIDFSINHIAALVITHVHIDHVGRIPHLLAAGFKGPIYCSEPSAKLLPLVLEDAMKIGVTRDKKLVEKFINLIRKKIIPLPYKCWHSLNKNLKIKLQPAGHILGSAYVECNLQHHQQQHRVVFSGDLGAPYAPLLAAPRSPYRADSLVIESTYGDRLHEGRKHRRQKLRKVIERAFKDRGAVLIPAFSIGRTQEILYELESLIYELKTTSLPAGNWQDLEIIVDSPLASRFTEVYRQLKDYWDREALQRVQTGRHPLSFENLYTVDSHTQHETAVNYIRSTGHPCIVIAASGMCAGGRILNYLKALIEDNRTDIVFIGYQADGTPGRDIQTYGPRGGYVYLDNQRYDIKANVHTLSGYSAHADQENLLNFTKRMRHKPTQVRIVHGDREAKEELKIKMKRLLPGSDVIIPLD